MIIQQSKATLATSVTDNLLFKRQTVASPVEKTTDTTTISQAAQERLAAENASDLNNPNSTNLYRVEGPVYSIEEMVNSKGRPLIAVKMTEAQVNEVKLREQQEKARENVNFNYAQAHQYQPIGQVIVNGKLIATVSDAGTVESPQVIPNLSEQSLSPADRLTEIARAVKGEIIYSNFLPTMGGWMGPSAPESALPPITARSMSEILEQEIAPAMEKKIAEWEAQTGKTYPRPT
ncbi:hypothetical protein [Methylotenera sp.]|uniref:hypothetical protein n=1 Tax=Methylotenera sp. TaxID=2051956 RepID=UPI002ED99D7D